MNRIPAFAAVILAQEVNLFSIISVFSAAKTITPQNLHQLHDIS